jgi:hypothetical protein
MTDTKHTKGHWIAYKGHDGEFKKQPYIITHVGRGVLPVIIAFTCDTPESEANADVLAASSYMLETLRSIAMIASCAPNDDPERADEQFEKIMNMANRAAKIAMGE